MELAVKHGGVGHLHHIIDIKTTSCDGRLILHATRFEGFHQYLVLCLDKAGEEVLLILRPCRIGLKLVHGGGHHLHLEVGVTGKHAITQHHATGTHGLYAIGAVGAEVEHVDMLQVGAIGEGRVLQHQFEVGI